MQSRSAFFSFVVQRSEVQAKINAFRKQRLDLQNRLDVAQAALQKEYELKCQLDKTETQLSQTIATLQSAIRAKQTAQEGIDAQYALMQDDAEERRKELLLRLERAQKDTSHFNNGQGNARPAAEAARLCRALSQAKEHAAAEVAKLRNN